MHDEETVIYGVEKPSNPRQIRLFFGIHRRENGEIQISTYKARRNVGETAVVRTMNAEHFWHGSDGCLSPYAAASRRPQIYGVRTPAAGPPFYEGKKFK